MTDWVNILSFSPRLINSDGKFGILQEISQTSESGIVWYPETDECKHIHMTWTERIIHMHECLKYCTAFRVNVLVQNSHIVMYKICVNPMLLRLQISLGKVLGEHHIISLISVMWKSSVTYESQIQSPDDSNNMHLSNSKIWNKNMILLDYQLNSLNYMKNVEHNIRTYSCISYNNHINICDNICVDIVKECFVTEEDIRGCPIRGAFLCDEAGSGKTAVSLRLISEDNEFIRKKQENYSTNATLIIVPTNLPSQWNTEIEKFYEHGTFKIINLLKSSDLKSVSMNSILNADIVLTTMSFIKSNKTYNDIFTTVLNKNVDGYNKKSRALFKVVAKNKEIDSPILQIINWNRIIVDEIHELKGKDLKILKCFSCDIMWGITATPVLNINLKDECNELSLMMEYISFLHPNIYKSFIHNCMRGYVDIQKYFPQNKLQLVQLSDIEKEKKNIELSDEELVLSFTTFDDENVNSYENTLDITQCIVKEEEHNIDISVASLINLQQTLVTTGLIVCALWCVEYGNSKIRKSSILYKAIEFVAKEKLHIDSGKRIISLIDKKRRQKNFMEMSLKKLEEKSEICSICMHRSCSVIIKCGHLFCRTCISKYLVQKNKCPVCNNETSQHDMFRVSCDSENSKLNAIKDMISSTNEPVLIIAQWKKVLRDIKIILNKSDAIILEGNTSQRRCILDKFRNEGGVLLVCVEDSFAGIRLPNVRYVIFSHALVGEYSKVKSIETQAIGRTLDSDKIEHPKVISFVTADSQEESIWRTTHK